MTTRAQIGEKLKETHDFFRDEAARYSDKAVALHEAWGCWDVDRLVALGVITEAEAEDLR